jgi:hypothetical protein
MEVTNSSDTNQLPNGLYNITFVDTSTFTIPANAAGAGGTCNYKPTYMIVELPTTTLAPTSITYYKKLFNHVPVLFRVASSGTINKNGNFNLILNSEGEGVTFYPDSTTNRWYTR